MARRTTTPSAFEEAKPEWLVKKKRPPWIRFGIWRSMPEDDKKSFYEDENKMLAGWLKRRPARRNWSQESLAEAMNLYYAGIKKEGTVAEHPISKSDYGRGVEGEWADLQASNANAAQYLDLFALLGRGFPRSHFNLCGELTVCAILDLELDAGLKQFRDTPSGADILASKGHGTSGPQLSRFIKAATDDEMTAEFTRAASSSRPIPVLEPEGMLEALNKGGLMVTLINIEGFRNNGLLKPVDESRKTIAHWVAVIDVSALRDGEHLIRVYNPFQNQEEIYTWPHFKASWDKTDGNFSRYGVVLAERA